MHTLSLWRVVPVWELICDGLQIDVIFYTADRERCPKNRPSSLPPKASAELEAEGAALVESFKIFPTNIICQTQSNAGSVPASGSCY